MKKKTLLVALILISSLAGIYLFNNWARCFAGTGAIKLPSATEAKRGVPISLALEMLRISAPGCYTGVASESYKDLKCGYKASTSQEWSGGKWTATHDDATKYIVECHIPGEVTQEKSLRQLDYYFEYSAWGNPPTRQTGSLSIE
jgi:hypothetical protein